MFTVIKKTNFHLKKCLPLLNKLLVSLLLRKILSYIKKIPTLTNNIRLHSKEFSFMKKFHFFS